MIRQDDITRAKHKREAKSELEAFGWKLNTFNHSEDTKIVLYLYDPIASGFTAISTANAENVRDVIRDIVSRPEMKTEALSGGINELMMSQLKKPNSHDLEVLGAALLAYAVQTQTYESVRAQYDGLLHFVVLNYHDKRTSQGMLRPFALTNPAPFLTPDELFESAFQVAGMDIDRHPDWFPCAEVVPIRPKND